MRRAAVGSVVAVFLMVTAALEARPPMLMEVQIGGEKIQGRVIAMDDSACWMMRRDGRLDLWKLNAIDAARRTGSEFRPWSSVEVRDQLRRELGDRYEVVASRRYVVAATRGDAARYAQLFDQVYNSFHRYFQVRGFRLHDPEVPLVAIVFPDRARFVDYGRKDGVHVSRGLVGYYHPLTNRVALFDAGRDVSLLSPPLSGEPSAFSPPLDKGGPGGVTSASQIPDSPLSCPPPSEGGAGGGHERFTDLRSALTPPNPPFGRGGTGMEPPYSRERTGQMSFPGRVAAMVEGDLRDTIIHEGIHQAAFNTGLHARIGVNPKWVTEGLATVFEADGIREPSPGQPVAQRINRERFLWFREFAAQRREPRSLAAFIADDRLFETAPLDAYAQAWALSFYLVETRPADYARYLKGIAARDPLTPYSASERVADFKKAFGRDLDVLDASFLRYLDTIAAR